jgi:hypothetical protein
VSTNHGPLTPDDLRDLATSFGRTLTDWHPCYGCGSPCIVVWCVCRDCGRPVCYDCWEAGGHEAGRCNFPCAEGGGPS